ncbi:cilia- and flagella-associated protein 61 [Drosophila gunungcola]|uniref:Cilia- and flagella-associated protein 61 N-terminal domain-containing protein n=1 Tax=Drosophila gunungcola TaxID=103775 RepID=A0A9P9YID0_9MUSC|nr:cilia- and flagella-associated protein 61 [Drosophila gunungcola]KAI8037540.1 hypothetical protein M5D96_009693 [Drosophila gunungcola]
MPRIQDTVFVITAGIRDLRRIEDLYEAKNTWHFGPKATAPLETLFLKNQAQRLLVVNKQDFHLVLAYCEFANHPNIPVLSNDLWLHWLNVRFCLDLPITLLNTIFFNFLICKEGQPDILRLIILEVFYNEHKVNYIIVVKPPDCPPGQYDAVQAFGKTYYPKNSKVSEQMHLPSVIVIHRRDVMPFLSFRKALPEDNDDIVEMIDSEDPELRKKHGDFYIAEHLLNMEESDHNDNIIIAEFEEEIADNVKGAGLMWLSESVDIELLAKNFHLERLGNLVRYTTGIKHARVLFDVFSVEQKSYKDLYTETQMEEIYKTHVGEKNPEGPKKAKEVLFSKYKHIYEELRKGTYYMKAFKDQLEIAFDLPAGEHSHSENRLQYLGKASNGFLLKMFQLHPLVRFEYTFYSLSAMFSAFPNHDYCVTMVPGTATTSPCQRELLRFFLPVAHRPNSAVAENMFVAHRSTLFGDLRVQPVERREVDEIRTLISSHSRKRDTLCNEESEANNRLDYYTAEVLNTFEDIIESILENPLTESSCFTIRCGLSKKHLDCPLVGFLILCPFLLYEDLSSMFMLPPEQFPLTHNRGEIVMFKLHPYFQMWCNPIIRTVALYDNYRELYYVNHYNGISLPNDLMYNMMPVEPCRMKKNLFGYKCVSYKRKTSRMSHVSNADSCGSRMRVFCHNLQPTKHLGGKNSLVIVGFSQICLAFLRTAIFAWNSKDLLNFKKYNCLPMVDISVLVPYGIVESAYDCEFLCSYCGEDGRNCYINTGNQNPFVKDVTHRMDVRHWVRFVPGTLKRINRQEKILHLLDGCSLHYEKLLLLAGSKFGFEDTVFNGHPTPLNYVTNNHRLDRIIFYHKLREMVESGESYNVIVYGYGLVVYECINFLVTHGCEAKNITYVQPHVPAELEDVGNPEVDARLDPIILEMVGDLGVTIYLSNNYSQFILSKDNLFIEKVQFVSVPSKKITELNCDLFVNYNSYNMNTGLENVLKEAGIEMIDRKIVVNARYITNDRSIYASGNIVMLPIPNFQYTSTSPQECAEKLAYELNMVKIVMQSRYLRPFAFTGMLPMGYQIIKLIQPKPQLIGQLPIDYSESMTTYENGEFCRIRLNKNMIVIEIVCVTKSPKRLYFLEYFCGKHAMLLNDLHGRFQSGWIKNFLHFFQQPWTELIMHDRFEDLQLKNRRLLLSMLLMNNKDAMNVRNSLESTQRQKLEENVIDFVRTYRKDFVHEFALPEDWGDFNL